MGKKLSREEVISRFKNVHGNKYGYLKFEFWGVDVKSVIACCEHGEFLQSAYQHYNRKQGCPQCAHTLRNATKFARLSASMLKDFKVVHGELYDYSKAVYISATEKVVVICKTHGEFAQSPNKHKSGRGCPECAEILLMAERSKGGDTEAFRRMCKEHGRSDSELASCGFTKMLASVTFDCMVHGTYSISAFRASRGAGCQKCSLVKSGTNKLEVSGESFIRRAVAVHGDYKYNYSKSVYEGARKPITIECLKHGKFTQQAESHLSGCGCPKCSSNVSKAELELRSFISVLGFSVSGSVRDVIPGHEIDILVGRLGVEYNGTYWHSERAEGGRGRPKGWAKSHMLHKQELCKARGIDLLHVYDTDDIVIIKQLLANRLGADCERYFARKCKVEEGRSNRNSKVGEFYGKNHIQGNAVGCKVFYLTMNGEIVAAMSFSKVSSERGYTGSNRFELRRYATCCNVVGGASRLLTAFLRKHPKCEEVVSYSDDRLFTGGMYTKLGFECVKSLSPDYSYTKAKKIIHKANFRHARMVVLDGFCYDENLTEKENCTNNGWYRIWDCGKKKWSLRP